MTRTPVKEPSKKGRAPQPGRVGRTRGFLREIRSELRKVVWPTRPETVNLTMIVIGVSTAVGLFLALADLVFAEFFQLLLR